MPILSSMHRMCGLRCDMKCFPFVHIKLYDPSVIISGVMHPWHGPVRTLSVSLFGAENRKQCPMQVSYKEHQLNPDSTL
eukprot:4830894-Amphidinium_carterae.2